ncbi:erythromycin esterase family protein [Pseudoalteromonas sp. YIC-656]|uniref:erythromycin esterase family protein n=1 Tax=Pseudoalteromonas pernae TaxID=3118054 RepID=UPI00324244E2
MKHILLSLLLLITVFMPVQAQINLAQTDDFKGLAEFGHAIADKRIVMLDELTHGEHQNFLLKAKLVRYLHQHHGFDVLLLESGLYDVAKVWENEKTPIVDQAAGNIFYMYAHSTALQMLFDYIDSARSSESPLILSGFDGRLSGELSRHQVGEELGKAIAHLPPSLVQGVDVPRFKILTEAIIDRDIEKFERTELLDYIDTAYVLRDLLEMNQSSVKPFESDGYRSRLIEGLAFVAQSLVGERRHDEHDIPMANNVKWLLDNPFKNKKVIVWGHFVHLNYAGFIEKHYDNLGSLLRQAYGTDVYHAHIGAAGGQYRDYVSMAVKNITPSQYHIEPKLAQAHQLDDHQALFISGDQLHKLAQASAEGAQFFGHQYRLDIPVAQWQRYWDGMFVIGGSTASEAQPTQ